MILKKDYSETLQSGKASPAKSFQSRQRPLAKSFESRERLWRSSFCKIWSPEASRDPNADRQSLSRLSNDFARGLWRLWNDFAGEAFPDCIGLSIDSINRVKPEKYYFLTNSRWYSVFPIHISEQKQDLKYRRKGFPVFLHILSNSNSNNVIEV